MACSLASPCKYLQDRGDVISTETSTTTLTVHGTTLKQVHSHRHLGVLIQADLRWSEHVALSTLFLLMRMRGSLNQSALLLVYARYIRPIIEYSLITSNMPTTLQDKLERFQRKAARICLRLPLFTPTNHSSLLHKLSLPTLSSRRHFRHLVLACSLTPPPESAPSPPKLRVSPSCFPHYGSTTTQKDIHTPNNKNDAS